MIKDWKLRPWRDEDDGELNFFSPPAEEEERNLKVELRLARGRRWVSG